MNNKHLPNISMGAISSLVMNAFPELKEEEEYFDVLWDGLVFSRFIKKTNPNTTMTAEGMMSEKTTQLGKEFLEFIKA